MKNKATKLIVVDDEEDLAEFVADVADDAGFDVLALSDPHEFGKYYNNDIGIFVFDLFMPGVDGIELLRFLAENQSKASVVFMSGKDSSVLRAAQELAKSLNITVLGSIQKPFRAVDLEEILDRYEAPQLESSPSNQDMALPTAEEIRTALDEDQFHLVFQPQVKTKDFSIIGAEVLLRWNHPEKGFIPPDKFIPLAEELDLIHDITWYVARHALLQAGDWNKQGLKVRVSINMSPKNFEDLDLPEKLAALTQYCGADIEQIVIEVTETALMVDVARYIDVLTRLRMKGFKLSIDDFGTGYSSLLQLIRVSFNELKIDQNFIRNLTKDKECRIISEISYMLAKKLDMYVVAEGVEDEDIWNELRSIGCEEAQGYWISRPLVAEDFPEWVREWNKAHELAG